MGAREARRARLPMRVRAPARADGERTELSIGAGVHFAWIHATPRATDEDRDEDREHRGKERASAREEQQRSKRRKRLRGTLLRGM